MKFIPKPLVETADISRGKPSLKSFLKTVLSAALVLLAIYLLLGLAAEFIARTLPDSWERELGSVAQISMSGNSNDVIRAKAILARLTEGESLRKLDYQIFVSEHELPNAFAMPGGGIALTPDLLNTVETENGLAFVIAHELGHHHCRHILRGLGRRLILRVAGAVLFNYDGMSTVETAYQLAENGYSRKQESLADEFALRLVRKKFGNTRGALEFLEKVQAKGDENFWLKYAGTHPLTSERLENLRALAKEVDEAKQ